VSHLRPVVVLEPIELRHRIAALSATELVARAPIVGNVLLWIWLSRWWSFSEQCGARGYARRAVHRLAWERISGESAARYITRAFRLGC
jgi:hypothetical protein